jgi:hypothetical protein
VRLGQADVAPTMEWLAEGYLVEELKTRLRDALLAEPIVYTSTALSLRAPRARQVSVGPEAQMTLNSR